MEYTYFTEKYGKDEGDYQLHIQKVNYFNEADNRYTRPIVNKNLNLKVTRLYDSSWSLFDNHTYPGGSLRINMLKNLLGEKNFWKAVTKYVKKYQKKTVETEGNFL
jgi:aminopeptidase N